MSTSRGIVRRLGVVALVAMCACAPTVDGPVERQRAIDREDAAHVGGQLAQLPGAVAVTVTVHRPARDPLASAAPSQATAAALIVIDDKADRAAITASATALLRATAPEIASPSILVEVGAIRPVLAKVGPFTVEEASKGPLKAALVSAFAMIVALAAWIAVRERARSTPA